MAREVSHLTVRLAGRDRSSFRVCGVLGFVAAAGLASGLAGARGLSVAVEGAIVAVAVLTFFALALANKVLTGRETLIYYHHEVAVLLAAAATAALMGASVLGHLDATALGLGAFLACGRVGCTLAGCCHGRPAARGIRYGRAHVAEGFPPHLAGVPLVPVQAIEAAAVALLVASGTIALADGAAAGTGLGIYVSGYAVLRFGLELLRGDEARRRAAGLTEAQWTSLALLAVMASAFRGPVELVALAVCVTVLLPLALVEAHRARGRLRRPRHVREVADPLERSRREAAVVVTSEDVVLSAGVRDGVAHSTVSASSAGPAAAELVRRLRHPDEPSRVLSGRSSVLHLVIGGHERA